MEYKFEGRYMSFCDSLRALTEARERDRNDTFVLSGTSAKFSITFELAWKVMKDVITEYYGVADFVTGSPKEVMKKAFKLGMINNDAWMEMLKLRNLLAHDYDLSVVKEAFDKICSEYIDLLEELRLKILEIKEED